MSLLLFSFASESAFSAVDISKLSFCSYPAREYKGILANELALEGDLHKKHTSGGSKILLIKNLCYQDIRATQPSFIWSFDDVSKKSTCSLVNPSISKSTCSLVNPRVRGRKQEKIRAEFSQNSYLS